MKFAPPPSRNSGGRSLVRFCSCMPAVAMVLLFPFSLHAQKVYDFNARCREAYHEIISLKLEKGQDLLNQEKTAHPANLIPFLLENYIDFFLLYFNEDPEEYRRRKQHLDERLKILGSGPETSPFYLFSKSILHFQWAAVKIKFGHNWDAGWEFRRSLLQVRENRKKFPSFTPNAMLEGTMQVTAGTIPEGYRWLGSLLGISGTIKEGMAELNAFIDSRDDLSLLYRDEALFYWLYLKFYIQNQKAEVLDYISGGQLDLHQNHLFAYLAANLALNAQHSDLTIQVIRQMNHGADYLAMPAWDQELGSAKLNRLDPDAHIYLENFVNTFKGNFYVKEVLQKISWHYFLSGNQSQAEHYRKLVLERGTMDTEADKQAQNEAKGGIWPDPVLLKARLLDDGGYYAQALEILHSRAETEYRSRAERLEYEYRLGRIYDDLQRKDEAIRAYLSAIRLGQDSHTYYAARAALQIGYIFEERKDFARALDYFQQCIAMKDHEYKNSLDQKAKAGIQRCQSGH